LALVFFLGSVVAAQALRADATSGADGLSAPKDIAHDVALAREALRKTGVEAGGLPVQSARSVTWRDSSLGCGERGVMSSEVLTRGREIEFRAADRTYIVHVAGEQALLCGAASQSSVPTVRFRNLDVMVAQARETLGKILGVPVDEITQGEVIPKQWPDAGLGCPSQAASNPGTPAAPGPVAGFKILLLQAGHSYAFHTDLKRVFPCPPIESR
jgi:hypothetical protein